METIINNKNVYICAVAKGMQSITYFINAKRKWNKKIQVIAKLSILYTYRYG